MIEIDYGNYLSNQAEWADGLMRAAEHAQTLGAAMSPTHERDLTLAAGNALTRLTDRDAAKVVRIA